MKTTLITLGLLMSSLSLFSQDNLHLKSQFNLSLDSLTDWSYDNVQSDIEDSNLVCRIAFFRNKEIPDELSQKVYGRGLRPLMILNVYPISLIDTVKRMSLECKILSSCVPPNVGGDYYILKDYILINYTSCVTCASSNYNTDLCRANINRILSTIKKKHYSSIDELLADLPVKKKRFK
jgi:hypothetical protein